MALLPTLRSFAQFERDPQLALANARRRTVVCVWGEGEGGGGGRAKMERGNTFFRVFFYPSLSNFKRIKEKPFFFKIKQNLFKKNPKIHRKPKEFQKFQKWSKKYKSLKKSQYITFKKK